MDLKDPVWERQDGESPQAFAAFVAYRDMGAQRSLDAVHRQSRGQQEGNKRATGRLNKWSADHHWTDRARAWDNHLDAVGRLSAETKTAERVAWLIGLRDEDVTEAVRDAELLVKQGRYLAQFPATTQRRDGQGPNGADLVIEAANAVTIRTGMILIQAGREMRRQAIRDGLAAVLPSTDPSAPPPVTGEPGRRPRYIEVEPDGDGSNGAVAAVTD